MAESKKKKLVIELDSDWVLKHRDDDKLPIASLQAEINNGKLLEVKEASLTSLTLIYDESTANFDGIKGYILQFFNSRYPEDNFRNIISFYADSAYYDENSDKEDEGNPDEETEEKSILSQGVESIVGESEVERNEKVSLKAETDSESKREDAEKNIGKVLDKINNLVGAAEFKNLAKELASIAEEIKRTNTYEVFTNQCYLFSIGDGCGLTTYLERLAELISESELCSMSYECVREVRLAAYREGTEPFESVNNMLDKGNDQKIRVLCVDISEWMDKTDNRYFKQFLRSVEKHANEFIVVFRVPFVDKDILARIEYSLSDLLSVKTVSFPPLSPAEIKLCAEAELKRYSFSITKSAWKYFFDRISEEKSDGKFYGVNTVKKVVRELVYHKHIVNAQKENKSRQITVGDCKALCANADNSDLSGEEMLNKLVGVDGIKERVNEIITQIELAVKDKTVQRPCIHMRFVGNPGTGKTTVARVIGKILKEKGVLRVGAFFEYGGRDFCGRYVGETAPKTSGICRDAYGSVLFIDEAYSLYRGDADSRDYGREAIDTLIAEMENHRNDFVVIMAGYTDDMDKLMKGNLGLLSRMPYTIEFPNFTREQLYDIFVSMVKSKFKYENKLLGVAREFFTKLPDGIITAKEFANARYVRNLFERTWAKAAMRCQLSGKTEIVLTGDDFEHASADKEFVANVPKKSKIGFN